jgi:DNA-binding NarL/FixJ family response regulator
MIIRILVVDDQRLMREGLRTILNLEADLDVVGLAENGSEALTLISELQPDIVLMDIRMPVMDGVEATRCIRERWPDCRVLILTTFDDDEYIVEALKNGAVGYLLKDLPSERLITAIREAAAGHPMMQSEIAARLIARLTEQTNGSKPPDRNQMGDNDCLVLDLTVREKEILALIAQGKNNREIAATLFISEGTVKNYVSTIYDKTGISERSKLIMFALENRIV